MKAATRTTRAILLAWALVMGPCATGHAQSGLAQDSAAPGRVTLYGLADTGLELVTHVGANGNTVVRMPAVTGEYNSRWGIRGAEPLGGDWATVFTLESGLNLRDGSLPLGNRLFGRQAWIGLQGPYGTLSLGRQYTMTYWALRDANLLGPDIYGGVGSFDGYIPSRSDNTLAYKGTWHGLMAGATYSFARDASGNSVGQGTCAGGAGLACRQGSAMLRYDAEHWGMAASYDEQRGGPGAAASFWDGVPSQTFTNPNDKDARMQLNGHVAAGALKVGGGWLGRKVHIADSSAPDVRSSQFYLTAAYRVTPALTLDGGAYRILNREQDARGTIMSMRATYAFSNRTAVYGQWGYLFNSAHAAYTLSQGGPGATPGTGMNQLGVMVGLWQMF